MRKNTIVTISRQYGSGGKEIAEILAKKMGVRCYDRQIVYLAAEKKPSPVVLAALGVYVHGLAGDMAAESVGQRGMTAGDIIRFLPEILK